jgi:hypothetical protein
MARKEKISGANVLHQIMEESPITVGGLRILEKEAREAVDAERNNSITPVSNSAALSEVTKKLNEVIAHINYLN